MADFTVASRIGQGLGQNAFAGGGSQMNPLNMMQLMQTMELQRAAEQRALAGEARAQALHAPHLATAQTQAAASALGFKQKQEEDELSNLYAGFRQKYDDPFSDAALKEARKTNAKLYSTLLDQKTAHGKLAAEADVKTAEALTKKLELNKKTADLWLPALESGLVADQQSYSAMRKDLLRGQENLASLFPEEYSPEAVKKFQTAFSGTKNITTQSMAGGDVLVLVGGKPYGLVDPSIKGGDGAMPGVRPFGPGEAPRIPAPAAPAATAPQTMGFSGMGQLAPAGQQAAQNVMAAFPGARITSGLRTPERNSAVGGATSSYHLSGNAIDVVPPDGMPMNVFAAQLQQQLGPQGYTVMYGDPGHLDHVHIQPGAGMNVPRTFNPSVAATDMAAGRQPMGMMAPAALVNALAPVAAAQIMQQNAMIAPQQALPNIAPGLTQAAAPAPAPTTTEPSTPRPRREDYPTHGQFIEANRLWEQEQSDIRKERRKAEEAAKPKPLTPAQEKKLRDDIAVDYKSVQTTIDAMDDVVKTVKRMRDVPDNAKSAILGYTGEYLPNLTSSAKDAQTRFNDLKGKVISLGKEAQSLSGAIGSIANQEWGILASTIASLDPKNLDPKILNDQLDIIEAKAKGTVTRIKDAYRRQYQEEMGRFGDRFKLPENEKSAKTIVKRGKEKDTGRAVVQYSDGTIDYAD